jgi:hypothetical protein
MSGRLRLVQLVAVADVGMVRVAWSASWSEYRVRATGPAGQVAEYFTDDRTDALGTADAMLAQLAAAAGMPA